MLSQHARALHPGLAAYALANVHFTFLENAEEADRHFKLAKTLAAEIQHPPSLGYYYSVSGYVLWWLGSYSSLRYHGEDGYMSMSGLQSCSLPHPCNKLVYVCILSHTHTHSSVCFCASGDLLIFATLC